MSWQVLFRNDITFFAAQIGLICFFFWGGCLGFWFGFGIMNSGGMLFFSQIAWNIFALRMQTAWNRYKKPSFRNRLFFKACYIHVISFVLFVILKSKLKKTGSNRRGSFLSLRGAEVPDGVEPMVRLLSKRHAPYPTKNTFAPHGLRV